LRQSVNADWERQFPDIIWGDPSQIESAVLQRPIDAVIFAIATDHNQSDIETALDVNVKWVWKYLSLLAPRIRTWIYFSTQQVYGAFGSAVSETSLCQPINAYGLTHLMAEEICQHYHRHSPVAAISLRLSNAYGAPAYSADRFLRFAVLQMCAQAFHEKK